MELVINHRTRYSFGSPVFLEPHVVRLRPRVEPGVRLLDHRLDVEPEPTVRSDYIDPYGNIVTGLWFGGTTSTLTLASWSRVDRAETNPFEFLSIGAQPLPRVYSTRRAAQLSPYLDVPEGVVDSVRALAWDVARESEHLPDRFAGALATRLHGEITYNVRDEGDPQPAGVTLATGVGACRDLAVLYVACCRAVGLAARFVSGYAYDNDVAPELHAWAEVYLPGGGWRGFDPADGLAVAHRHVAVAAGSEAEDAAPVSGTFRGGGSAALDTTLEITRQPA